MERDNKKKCAQICYQVMVFVFLFVMLGVFSGELDNVRNFESLGGAPTHNSQEMAAYVESISTVYDEIRLAPIRKIYLIDWNSTCSGDSILQLYDWNTKVLCNCPYDSKITVGACSKSQRNCYTSSSRALSLNIWRGKKFCVNRYEDGTWYQTTGSCSTDNYLTCNYSNFNICIKKKGNTADDVCPISKITIISDQDNLPSISDLLNSQTSDSTSNDNINNTQNQTDNQTNNTTDNQTNSSSSDNQTSNSTSNITNNNTENQTNNTATDNNTTDNQTNSTNDNQTTNNTGGTNTSQSSHSNTLKRQIAENSTLNNTNNSSNNTDNTTNNTNETSVNNTSNNGSDSQSTSTNENLASNSELVFSGNFSDSLPSEFYWSRNTQYNPIINLKVGINGKPCIFSLEENQRVSTLQLLQANPDGCKEYGSDTSIYSLLDRQYEWDFYVNNDLLEITSDLADLQSYIKDISQLYSETWPANSCDKSLNIQIINNLDDNNDLIDSRKGSDVIGLLMIVIAIIFFLCNLYFSVKRKKVIDSINLTIWLTILIIIQGVICPISLYYTNKIKSDNKFLFEITDSSCFQNSGYNRLFDDYKSDLLINSKMFRDFSLTILYYSMILFFVFIFYFFDKFQWNRIFIEDLGGPLEGLRFKMVCDEDDCTCLDCLI